MAVAALECADKQKICKLRVFGEERAVEVTTKGIVHLGTFGVVAAVVARSDDDGAQRTGTRAEERLAAVIFEPDTVPLGDGHVDCDGDVADEALGTADGMHIEGSDTGERLSGVRFEVVAQELVATADGQHDHAVGERGPQLGAVTHDEIVGDERLAAVLTATKEAQVIA